jgi:hypothetical protein
MEGLAGDAIVAGSHSLEARVCAHGGLPHRAAVVEAARRVGRVAAGMPRLGALRLHLRRQRAPALLDRAFRDEDGGLLFDLSDEEGGPDAADAPGDGGSEGALRDAFDAVPGAMVPAMPEGSSSMAETPARTWSSSPPPLSSPMELRRLDLGGFGNDVDLWGRFAERFAPAVKQLEVDGLLFREERAASALAGTLPARFSSLNRLAIKLDSRPSLAPRKGEQAELRLLRAVPFVPTAKAILVALQGSNAEHALVAGLKCISKVVPLSSSLTTLHVCHLLANEHGDGDLCDGSALLESLLRSKSLQEVRLERMVLTNSNEGIVSRSDQARVTNDTV